MQVDFNAIGHPRWLIALYANKKDVDNYIHPFMTHNLQVQVTWMLLASFAHGVQPFDNYSSCDEKSKQTTQENKYVSSST